MVGMRKSQLWAGLIAPLVAYSGILTAIYVNRSWWRLTDNAISDLGKLGLPHNWLLNVPLVITAVLAIYYASGLLGTAGNSVEKAGIWILIVGFVFLALIGLFPEGTSPHYYVSWGFFLTASFGLLIAGVGMGISGDRKMLYFTVVLFVLAWILALWAMRTFKGVAIPEFIGALTITLWHYTVLSKVLSKTQ
ncbi:putative membrane protein [Thermococcus stetteri]|nr:putative membrane protein [Thermococcus stetteri]